MSQRDLEFIQRCWDIAYHESGHAVVHRIVGVPISSVEMGDPDPFICGHVSFEDACFYKADLDARLAIYLAGEVVQRRYTGIAIDRADWAQDRWAAEAAFVHAHGECPELALDQEAREAHFERVRLGIGNWLEGPLGAWNAVRAVAELLMCTWSRNDFLYSVIEGSVVESVIDLHLRVDDEARSPLI